MISAESTKDYQLLATKALVSHLSSAVCFLATQRIAVREQIIAERHRRSGCAAAWRPPLGEIGSSPPGRDFRPPATRSVEHCETLSCQPVKVPG